MLYTLQDRTPELHGQRHFIAPNASVIGSVILQDNVSIWFNAVLRGDNDLAQLAALRAGLGIGGCQENIAKRYPDLVRLLADTITIPLEVWLVMHEDVRDTPRIRRLFDHLAEGLSEFVNGR